MLFQITDYNGKYHINSVLHIFFYIQLDLAIKMILAKLALLLNAHESFFAVTLQRTSLTVMSRVGHSSLVSCFMTWDNSDNRV